MVTLLPSLLLGAALVGILWSGTKPVGTLDAPVPARAELTGSLDGVWLLGTAVDMVPGGFGLAGTLEGAGLVGTPVPLRLLVSARSPAPPEGARPGVEGERPGLDTDTVGGAGKRLALEVERLRGWKETVGDTGPR